MPAKSIRSYWKFVSPHAANASVNDSQDIAGNRGLYGNYTWYHRIIQGSTTRLVRYREYDVMDNDIDVARALDIMAEEMTGNNPKTKMPLEVTLETGSEQDVPSHTVATLNASLRTWCKIHRWQSRLFNLCRNLIKYGDAFFERPKDKNKRFTYIHPKHVISAVVSEDDITDVRGWHIQTEYKKPNQYWQGGSGFSGSGDSNDYQVEVFDKDKIVRFTISDDMSEEAPFGMSVLRPMYRTFKQKELLEDSILIYRISRAPEKRAFYIDVGNRPDHQAARVIEMFRNEIKQKKIPTRFNGKWQAESVYNPQSMNEDFYFATRPDGQGSRVETLPGGQGLGELSELDYFYRKMWRALRIPASYMGNTTEDPSAIDNQGRVGIAYMQEIKFSLYIERLQGYVEEVLDEEFKRWLYESNIHIDPTIYRVTLPEPSDFAKSRQQSIDSEMIGNFTNMEGTDFLSKRFAMQRYLGLTPDEIKVNERMLRQEKGLDPDGDERDLPKLYFPETAEAEGFEGGLGGGGGSPFAGGQQPEGAEGDLEGEGEEGGGEEGENQQGQGEQGEEGQQGQEGEEQGGGQGQGQQQGGGQQT